MLINQIGEYALISWMREIFAPTSGGALLAIGDDAAVLDAPIRKQLVLTTDLLLEGVHFKRHWQTPQELGGKALAVSLSDLAAMGADPEYALVSIACAGEEKVHYILDICRGLSDMALKFDVAIVGGDTSRSEGGLVLSVTAGGTVPEGRAITRAGANDGDSIYITGFPGRSAAGLRLLESGQQDVSAAELVRAFIAPEPRLAAGRAIAGLGASAMIDLSDGLAADMHHICFESGAGARVSMSRMPVDPELERLAGERDWSLEELMLGGGEDYELLFTANRGIDNEIKSLSLESGLTITAIGEILKPEMGMKLVSIDGISRPFSVHGFNHFV